MHYLDTGILVAILLGDPEHARAEDLLSALRSEPRPLSEWSGVERFSAIARRVHARELRPRKAMRARQLYVDEFANELISLDTGFPDFERARRLLSADHTGLRGGDALHLAVALNQGATSFRTFDETLPKAANRSGIDAPPV